MNQRVRLVQIFFFIWAVMIVGRLFYWQVIKAEELRSQAKSQYSTSITLPASRGEILSSDGFPIVTNTQNYLLYAQPKVFTRDNHELNQLAELLPATGSAREILFSIPKSKLSWVALAHGVDPELKKNIEAIGLPGLGFESEPSRFYPDASISAYLTGFVGKDDLGNQKGYFGLEGFYDRLLSGKPGKLISEQDAFSRPIPIANQDKIVSQNGGTLTTSIDRTLQYLVFQKLDEGIRKFQADSGTITIIEAKTGHILAMAALPGYIPDKYSQYNTSLYKNPIISDFYEPGSTFKAIVMASALDSGILTPQTQCTICTGPVTLSGLKVHNYDDKYHPGSTMTDVILHSDNVGMVNVAQKLGREKLLNYLRKFGFGKLTGVDLQEESSPQLRPDEQWREVDWGTAAFGQGIAVTRLQLLAAVNAIANRGEYVAPRVVTNLTQPSPFRVISQQSSLLITQMMVNGVEKGEVRYYKPSGFLVAGKTGTAQVPIEGHYDKDSSIASFIGFAPADNPKFTMLVTLKNPRTAQWGSTSAAPIWFEVAKEIFRYYRISPQLN